MKVSLQTHSLNLWIYLVDTRYHSASEKRENHNYRLSWIYFTRPHASPMILDFSNKLSPPISISRAGLIIPKYPWIVLLGFSCYWLTPSPQVMLLTSTLKLRCRTNQDHLLLSLATTPNYYPVDLLYWQTNSTVCLNKEKVELIPKYNII